MNVSRYDEQEGESDHPIKRKYMMYNGTGQELANITDNVMFEYMMCDLLSSYKYKGIDPQSPGMIDNGKDGCHPESCVKVCGKVEGREARQANLVQMI